MVKVKMICRHTAVTGVKLEQGLTYFFNPHYAQELISHGLAALVAPEIALPAAPEIVSPENVITKPPKAKRPSRARKNR